MVITDSVAGALAIDGGRPVRGDDNPLPGVFPRDIPPRSRRELQRVVDEGFTSNSIERFETEFAAACGVKHAVALANCTSAIHGVVAALGLGPSDEVIVSPITDFGSVGGVISQGAKPVFPDVDRRTGNVTAEHIEKVVTSRSKAIIAVHFYGLLCDLDPIVEVARKHNLILIEDVCQATLAEYKGRPAGSIGDVGCFSFDAEKHLSTDHGGMAITDDQHLADRIRFIGQNRGAVQVEGFGRTHQELGFNFRYGQLEAAVGLGQLERLPQQNRRRRELAALLSSLLEDVEGVDPPWIPPGCDHVYWLYHFQIDPDCFSADATKMAAAMAAEGLSCGTAPYYLMPKALSFLPDREAIVATLPNAIEHLERTIRWQWTDKHSADDVTDIARIVEKVCNAYRA